MPSSPVNPFDDLVREVAALPEGAAWIRGALIKRLVVALVRDRARAGTNVDEIPTDKGRYFNAQAGGGRASTMAPWQPYLSPFTGTGDPPSDQGRKINIIPAFVSDGSKNWPPARENIEITVPANCTDGYHVWLAASVGGSGTITALDYGHGTTLPGAVTVSSSEHGTPPPTAYDLLFTVTSTSTAVELAGVRQYRRTSLSLVPIITQVNSQARAIERRMVFVPERDPNDIPSA